MSTIDWLVIGGGLVAALWVNWYFFIAAAKDPHAATGHDHFGGDS